MEAVVVRSKHGGDLRSLFWIRIQWLWILGRSLCAPLADASWPRTRAIRGTTIAPRLWVCPAHSAGRAGLPWTCGRCWASCSWVHACISCCSAGSRPRLSGCSRSTPTLLTLLRSHGVEAGWRRSGSGRRRRRSSRHNGGRGAGRSGAAGAHEAR